MQPTSPPYAVRFAVDYPDRELNRLTSAFRIVVAIPIVIVLATVSGSAFTVGTAARNIVVLGGGLLFVAPLIMILFREKYPRWWFDWNVALLRFMNRVWAYLFLLRDEYPSTDEEQAVHLDIPYPDVHEDLNRWLPLVKWFLAIPHYIVLVFIGIGAFFALVAAWFAVLFTGRYPRGIADFVIGAMRWNNRVTGYAFLMATDTYPPFRLAP